MDIITLSADNIDNEHICCSMPDKKSIAGGNAKKDCLKNPFQEGLKFKKTYALDKIFIEYLPAENA